MIRGISRNVRLRFALAYLRAHNVIAGPAVRRWTRRLGLGEYRVVCQPTHPLQVTGPDGLAGHALVGVIADGEAATIVHTRPLRQDDIVHELLHVAHPEWPHPEVELWTELLIADPALSALIRGREPVDSAVSAAFGFRFTRPAPTAQTIPSHGKEISRMKEATAYNLRTKKQVKMMNPELVTLKNGRKALRGIAEDDGKTTVVKILGAKALAEWEKA